MTHIIFIGLGGALGAVSRYLVSRFSTNVFAIGFPIGTLIVNVTGAFLIGFLFSVLERAVAPSHAHSFLLIGFLGAYTTFSTYSLETINMLKAGDIGAGLLNIVLSNVLCLFMVIAGRSVHGLVFPQS